MTPLLRPLALGAVPYGWAVPLAGSVLLLAGAVRAAEPGAPLNSFPYRAAAEQAATVALWWVVAAAAVAVVLAVRAGREGA